MTPEERIKVYERHMECQRRELATVYDEAVKMGLVEPCGSCGQSRVPPFFVLTKKIKEALANWNARKSG